MSPEKRARASKLLSMALRHRPEELGLTLDANGWASVAEVLAGCAARGRPITFDDLVEVVETNDKRRFSFDEKRERIRANQGHSVEVDLELKPVRPPATLYHGTAERDLPSIMKDGVKKMGRHHVHLSADALTAEKVGERHGRPVVLVVDAEAMCRDGHAFFLSANGVWLTDKVPPRYLSRSAR